MRVAARKAAKSARIIAAGKPHGAPADSGEARHELDEIGLLDVGRLDRQLERRVEDERLGVGDAPHRLASPGANCLPRCLRRQRVHGRETDRVLHRDADRPRHGGNALFDDRAISGNEDDRNAVAPGQCCIEQCFAARRAVDGHAVDVVGVGVGERRGVARLGVIAREKDRVDCRVQALHHAPRFGRTGDNAHVVIRRKLVEQEIAHGPVRVVDDDSARAAFARAVDGRAHFLRHVRAKNRILVKVAGIALLPRAQPGRALHVARNVDIHWRNACRACARPSCAATFRGLARKARS